MDTLDRVETLGRIEATGRVEAVIDALEKINSGAPNNVDLSRCIRYLTHVRAFLTHEQDAIDRFRKTVLGLDD